MIFVTVGSQKFPFDRLLKQLDELVESGVIQDKIFAQIGAATYEPRYYEWERFVDREKYASCIDACDYLITHGGEGAIMTGLLHGKKVIANVRYSKYGEHLNDHQLMIVKALEQQNHIIAVYDTDSLAEKYREAQVRNLTPYLSQKNRILQTICEFIDNDEKG